MMNPHTTLIAAPNIEAILGMVKHKTKWLRRLDRIKLAQKYCMSYSALNRQLIGNTKRINVNMVADALDIMNANEAKILTRLR